MCHGFDSRATRNLDFPQKKYIDHISESFLWHFPTAQRFRISHSHKRDRFHLKAYYYVFMSQMVVGSILGGVNNNFVRNA